MPAVASEDRPQLHSGTSHCRLVPVLSMGSWSGQSNSYPWTSPRPSITSDQSGIFFATATRSTAFLQRS